MNTVVVNNDHNMLERNISEEVNPSDSEPGIGLYQSWITTDEDDNVSMENDYESVD